MADHSPIAVTRNLEGVFAPFREKSHSNIWSLFLPIAPCWGDE